MTAKRYSQGTSKTHSAVDGILVDPSAADIDVLGTYGMKTIGIWIGAVGGGKLFWGSDSLATLVEMTVPQAGIVVPIQVGFLSTTSTVTDVTLLFPEKIT